jgi:hypothetical protein
MQQKDWGAARAWWLRKLRLQPDHLGAWKNLRETAKNLQDRTLIEKCDAEIRRLGG